MLFSSFITFATLAATVSASAFDLPDDPLFAQAHGISHKQYKSYIYRKNQYNPHRSPSKALRARQAAASPNCSATKKCGSKTEFCNHLGFCTSCPAQGIQNAAGNDCSCIDGYEIVSRSGVSYCECTNTVKGSLAPGGQCGTNPTCVSGYSPALNSAGGTQCVCTYGTADSLGRCTTCREGFRITSRNGINTCICANGASDDNGTGACTSCNNGYALIRGECIPKCTTAANCSGTSPFCSPYTQTCSSTCNTDSQCTRGQVCLQGTCTASSSSRCSTPKGTLCANGATCTYQGYCATNTSGPSGAYQGCYADKSTKRILGTMTSGVDYIKADVVDIGYCQNWCRSKGYAFSGVQYYNECYCGNTNIGQIAAENQCYLSCNTASAQLCGGDSYMSVYRLS